VGGSNTSQAFAAAGRHWVDPEMPTLMLPRLPSAAMPSHGVCGGSSSFGPECWTGSPVDSPASEAGGQLPAEQAPLIQQSMCRTRFILKHQCLDDMKHPGSLGTSSRNLHDIYEVETKALASGGFGTVSRARLRTANGVQRAVKAIPKRRWATRRMVQEEVSILRTLDHPYICRLYEWFEERTCIYLVMEYVDGQELFDYIQQTRLLTEAFGTCVMRQVFEALKYCHCRFVVHRDLKPENIMVRTPSGAAVDEVEVKLIDFGLAACCTSKFPSGQRPAAGFKVGSRFYTAPEVLLGNSEVDPASDMWSAGMVLHALLLGCLPEEEDLANDKKTDLWLQHNNQFAKLSVSARELLVALLQVDPQHRPTAGDVAKYDWLAEEARCTTPEQVASTMRAFSAFHRSTQLRKAIVTAVALQLADQQVAELQQQFRCVDSDKNGCISREELTRHLAQGVPDSLSQDVSDWVEKVFGSVDTDGSTEIEYTEWLAAALDEERFKSEEAIHAAFRVFDVDGSGKICPQELARITLQSASEIAQLLPNFDLDGDGELSFDEFRALVLGAPASLVDGAGDTHSHASSSEMSSTLSSFVSCLSTSTGDSLDATCGKASLV